MRSYGKMSTGSQLGTTKKKVLEMSGGGGHTTKISLMPLDWMVKFNGMIDLMLCRLYHSRNQTDTGRRETGLVKLIKSTLLPKP